MITAQEIKTEVLGLGACSLVHSAESIADLIALLKTPQGREFSRKYNYPSLELLRKFKDEIANYGVYVDAGFVTFHNQSDIILAGDTFAVYSVRAIDKPYYLCVMEGAKVIVNSYDYSVCLVDRIGGEAEVHEYDNSKVKLK